MLHHHERYDGEGYPDNITGDTVPLESRIIAITDSFDAITSDRPYRHGSSYPAGFMEIARHVNDQFCPVVFTYFDRVKERIAPVLDTIERAKIHHFAFVGHEELIHSRRMLL